MEKSENQIKFIKEFKPYIDSIELNDDFNNFIQKFKDHKYFKDYCKTIEELEKDKDYGKSGVKLFIFCLFTRDRETCDAIVQLLRSSNFTEQADKLQEYNRSSGTWELSFDVNLKVETRPHPFKNLSNGVCLVKRMRGKCIIINNVEEPQEPPFLSHGQMIVPKGLANETVRFKNVFEQLYFKVEVLTKLSADRMKSELTRISKDESLKDDQAFVTIVVSHGEDESVFGYNACEAMRKRNFGIIPKDDVEAKQEIERDRVSIKELSAIFSSNGRKDYLNSKPKLNFYICCREKNQNKSQSITKESVEVNDISPIPRQYMDTFNCFACAEGSPSFYDSQNGLSFFGMALTQSIAQYACDYSLSDIMTRTSKRLKQMYEEMEKQNPKELGSYAIEVNSYAMSFQLYFNPGHFEE